MLGLEALTGSLENFSFEDCLNGNKISSKILPEVTSFVSFFLEKFVVIPLLDSYCHMKSPTASLHLQKYQI